MNATNQSFLNSAVNVVFRDARLIGTVWVVTVAVALLAALLMPKTYEAKASILVKFGREYIYQPETGNQRPTTPQRSGMEEAINSEIQILASRDLKQRVIETVGVDRLYPKLGDSDRLMDHAIARFSEALSIRSIERSNVVNVYFRHHDPELAAETLNSLIDSFRKERVNVYSESDASYYEDQVVHLTNDLQSAEKRLVDFKQENDVFELSEESRLLLGRRNDLSAQLATAENRIEELTQRVAILDEQMSKVPRTVTMYTESERGRSLDEARSTLFALQLEENQLLVAYRDDSKPVTRVRNRIRQIEEFIAGQSDDLTGQRSRVGPNPIYESLKADSLNARTDLKTGQAGRDAIANQLSTVTAEIARLGSLNSKYDEYQRAVATKRDALEGQMRNLASAQALSALDEQALTNIRIIQPAVPPTRNIGMTRKMKVLLSIPLGLVAGLLFALIATMVRGSLDEPLAVERRTGLKVLATVDQAEKGD